MPDPIIDLPGEKWKPVVGWEGFYAVSNFGRVWSLDRLAMDRRGGTKKWRGRILIPDVQRRGHLRVTLFRDGKGRRVFVHQLVLEAFVGPCPDGLECCHGDGNPTNNRLENLRWDTHAANAEDAIRHGAYRRGERHGLAKLTKADVLAIRANPEGLSQPTLASKFGVGLSAISNIVRRKRWTHI